MSALSASYCRYKLTFKKPAGTSRGYLYHQENYFLTLTDPADPAYFGLGECGPLVGLSIDDRPDFEAKLAAVCRQLERGQPPETLDLAGFPALAFGLEMARRDLASGGQRHLFDTPFTRGETSLPIHGLIWMAEPAGLLAQIDQKVAQGYRCLKMKVGALPFEQECALLERVRRAYPADAADPIELRLDANGAFSPAEALDKLQILARFGVFALEQPLRWGQWPALADLCAQSPLPIALDEELIGLADPAERIALLETVRPAYLVLKPTLIGGLAEAADWIALAEARGIGWWVNSALESNLGLNAIAQWTSSLGSALVQGLGTGQLYTNNLPAPLYLRGSGLGYDPAGSWDLAAVSG